MTKTDKRNILIMTLLVVLLGIFFLCTPYLFGSKTDWLGQHIAFPDYFRNLFYQTGNLFPEFAPHLGGGQNIFHFSYYGLWNPIILVSYFFPFIAMKDYIMFTSLLGILASMILLYYFLKTKLGSSISLCSCFLYFCACPIIFHAHRHIMFVNYMPFLILGMIGVDQYFKKQTKICLTISVFFMILTSYYYSIGGIVALVIYGIYCWLKENKFQVKLFLKDGIRFVIPILFGVLFSAFLLLPTAFALLGGREGTHTTSIASLLLPSWKIKEILYTSYSLGLTSIFFYALIYFLTIRKKETRFLSIAFFLVCFLPIVVYLLNGTLYVRTKVLIPFLPLAIYLIGLFIQDIIEQSVFSRLFWFAFVSFQFLVIFFGTYSNFYIIDTLIMLVALFWMKKKHKMWIFYLPLFVIAGAVCISVNKGEGYVKKSYSDQAEKDLVQQLPASDTIWRTSIQENTLYGINQVYSQNHYSTSLYSSVYNADYSNFFMQTMEKALPYRNRLILASASHLPFQMLMAERYVIGDCNRDYIGYTKRAEQDSICLFENPDVYPIGYGSNQLLSESMYQTLPYPQNVEALLHQIIIPEDVQSSEFTSQLKPIVLKEREVQIGENIEVVTSDSIVQINVNKKDTIVYTLEEPISELLWIDFEVIEEPSCKDGDLSITINDITNKLTCSSWEYKNKNHRFAYIISENNLEELEITFAKGNYKIKDVHIYTLDYDVIKNHHETLNPFIVDKKQTKDHRIIGDIDMKEDGYFVLSIPYDQGFQVTVDGKKEEYYKVNTGFLGLPLQKGNHHIEIVYEAPYFRIGKWISIIAIMLYAFYLWYPRIKKWSTDETY